MKFQIITILVALAITVGCVTSPVPVPISPDVTRFRQSSSAVAFIFPQKRIFYSEQLYRVFWLANNYSSVEISGLWRPENDIADMIARSLNAGGIRSTSLHGLLDAAQVGDYYSQAEANYMENASQRSSVDPALVDGPAEAYFHKTPSYDAFAQIMPALQSRQVDYLVEVSAPDFMAKAFGFGMVSIQMNSNIRIIEVPSGKIIWTGFITPTEVYQLGGDLHQLEKDNLRLLKEAINAGIAKALPSRTIDRLFGPKS